MDDRPLLEFIQTKLNCGNVSNNKENTASYFNITDTNDLKFKLIPIFESFPLNTTKYLDFLSFKEALFMDLPDTSNCDLRDTHVKQILNLKSSMNSKRTDLILPINHIRITPYWLLGLIEGEGSFHLRRNSLTPTFSITLTLAQKPVIEKIVEYLTENLDKYSKVKAKNSKLFNISIEKSRDNAKPKVKLSILQIDYLHNIFIPYFYNGPFLNISSLYSQLAGNPLPNLAQSRFISKKSLDFYDFSLLTTLIYQGKHLIPEIKEFILQVSYSMNNYRLSTNKNKTIITSHYWKDIATPKILIEKYLNLPSIFILNSNGQVFNNKTGELVRDTYVIEVINKDNSIKIYHTIVDCANSLGITRTTIYNKISSGEPLMEKGILKIKKIRVFK